MEQTTKSRVSKVSRPGSTEAVKFTDGMLVTAEDLGAAMHYPLAVVQVLLRSYFGCGIVCGLEVTDPSHDRGADPYARADEDGATPGRKRKRGFIVEVGPGVALGCDGYPIELCETVKLDLSPDPCGCPIMEATLKFIAVRRITATEAPARGCGCGSAAGEPGQQCSRMRDHVLIQAFDTDLLPPGICMQPPAREQEDPAGREVERVASGTCACMKQCPSCDRCAEPWVLLGTVFIDADGVVEGRVNAGADARDFGGALYVKPIACVCSNDSEWANRYIELVERIDRLEGQRGVPAQAAPEALVAAATPATRAPVPAEGAGEAAPVEEAGVVVGEAAAAVVEATEAAVTSAAKPKAKKTKP